jgi:hypothetical protein
MTRDTLAARLRRLADRLGPPAPRRSPAPLVRLGGCWWHRDELDGWTRID